MNVNEEGITKDKLSVDKAPTADMVRDSVCNRLGVDSRGILSVEMRMRSINNLLTDDL